MNIVRSRSSRKKNKARAAILLIQDTLGSWHRGRQRSSPPVVMCAHKCIMHVCALNRWIDRWKMEDWIDG